MAIFMLAAASGIILPAQSIRQKGLDMYTGLNAYSNLQPDICSFSSNQASLAAVKAMSIACLNERRFMLDPTSLYLLALAIPCSMGNMGLTVNYNGYSNYQEEKIGLAYARQLGPSLSVGTSFNYEGFRIPGYSSGHAFTGELGLLYHINKQLNAGLHFYNPAGSRFSQTQEQLPALVEFGVGYDLSEAFFTGVRLIKEEGYPVTLNAGCQYQYNKRFYFKTGFYGAASTFFLGGGVSWKIYRLDMFGSYHPVLGVSPGCMLVMDFKK